MAFVARGSHGHQSRPRWPNRIVVSSLVDDFGNPNSGLLHVLVLPHHLDVPAEVSKSRLRVGVASAVRLDLACPPYAVVGRRPIVRGAPMPPASTDFDDGLGGAKDDVMRATDLSQQAPVNSVTKPQRMQVPPKFQFRACVTDSLSLQPKPVLVGAGPRSVRHLLALVVEPSSLYEGIVYGKQSRSSDASRGSSYALPRRGVAGRYCVRAAPTGACRTLSVR
jgi:hypothetical protein